MRATRGIEEAISERMPMLDRMLPDNLIDTDEELNN
jgi:hypothetical protein